MFRRNLLKNKTLESVPKGKNLYITNSCLNPFDNENFTNFNNNLNVNSRYQDTIESLNSIKKNDKNAYIIFVDNSKFNVEMEREIIEKSDLYFSIKNYKSVLKSRKSTNKGVPALVTIIFGLEVASLINKNRNNLNIIPARYKLISNQLNKIKSKGVYMKICRRNNNHSTRRIIIVKRQISKIRLMSLLFLTASNISLENIIGIFLYPIKNIPYLGIEGYINGNDFFCE
ncbi:hypothetical protein [Prochlorococcus marinus]|uniref:hypothetical protein n=1 Tax=Prochlorococcus marinus TaxID=1219 RepID=UPI001ADB0E4C|nr:hypothetical protein [Prochlorococcus marinus]MBO8219545.1 hypothetical protein [Prochlorococcus marinus CUG1416]